MKGWITLEDGGSGRWVYARPLDSEEPATAVVWAFIRIDDMVDACGKDAESYLSADVAVVDQLDIPVETVEDAIRSCGAFEYIREAEAEKRWLMIAQCCFDYGASSPCWEGSSAPINKKRKDWQWNVPSDDSPTFLRLRAAARRFAEENLFDAEERNDLLDSRIVNKIGQTAREYARGTDGLWVSLRRIKEDPNATPEQKLILATYQKAGQTLGAGPVPADVMEE